MNPKPYPRDLAGYGRHPPDARWPGGARVALQFVLNFEEGGENSVLHGDAGSEQFLSEMFNPPAFAARHLSMESIYEYGSRVGVWRILREFEQRGWPLTIFGVGMALALRHKKNPAFVYNSMSDGELDEGSTWEAAMSAAPGAGTSAKMVRMSVQVPSASPPSGTPPFQPFDWPVQSMRLNQSPES